MAVTTVIIEAKLTRNGELIDHSTIGFGDSLGFTITATGTALPETLSAAVELLNWHSLSVATKTIILTRIANSTVQATGTGELQNFDFNRFKTSHNTGNSTLKVTVGGIIGTTPIQVVIASAWTIKSQYFPGIQDAVRDYGLNTIITLINDAQVWREIENSIAKFERASRILLRKRIISSEGYISLGYDIKEDAVLLMRSSARNYLATTLPWGYIQGTPKFKTMISTADIWEIPQEWFSHTMDRKDGRIKFVPSGSGTAQITLGFNAQNIPVWPSAVGATFFGGSTRYLPNACHFWYTAGWDEEHTPIPGHYIRWIQRDCAMSLADLWWLGLTQGLGSNSLSADGLSRSLSRNDPGFTQAKKQWQELQKEDWNQIKDDMPFRIYAVS